VKPHEAHETGECWERFSDAMDDDFNSARGIGILFDTVRSINRLLDRKNNDGYPETKKIARSHYADILRIGGILGILNEPPKVYFEKKQTRVLEQQSIDPEVIDQMIKERNMARKAKNWKKADQIRNQLADMNIILEDRSEGTVWKINE
jgi:cysteinyl-tRNA synthetase